jgi:hypothetical protein
MRHGFRAVVESVEVSLDDAKARDGGAFGRAFEQNLQTDAYAHKWLSRLDVLSYCGEVTGGGELGHAVAKVTDAGKDKFLAEY